jgi:isochorismate pyruvate lyase
MEFERYFSGAPWEAKVGYCRALRAGDMIFLTGTAAVDEKGQVVAPGDGYRQAQRCLEIIDEALRNLRAHRSHIVRTRLYVTEIERWAEFGRAHREFFDRYPPCATMIQVARLIDPQMLIEIEAEAVCRSTGGA